MGWSAMCCWLFSRERFCSLCSVMVPARCIENASDEAFSDRWRPDWESGYFSFCCWGFYGKEKKEPQPYTPTYTQTIYYLAIPQSLPTKIQAHSLSTLVISGLQRDQKQLFPMKFGSPNSDGWHKLLSVILFSHHFPSSFAGCQPGQCLCSCQVPLKRPSLLLR